MRIQERCFLLGLCLLGGVTFSLTASNAETRITTIPGANDEDIQKVQPLRIEWRNDSTDLRNVYSTKEVDQGHIKATIEAKKKAVIDFKAKSDQKYQKPAIKDDDLKRINSDAPMSLILPTTTPIKVNQSSETMKSIDTVSVTIPFLLHGVPIVAVTKTTLPNNLAVENTTSNTMKVQVTKKTTSSRGRALNVTASEPTNSLHVNITDLSDISMDENDKEVEGGEYIAPHNVTAINISSTLLPKTSVCAHENRTYSMGEKVVRDCEEKCVCSENGITDCQPLCVSPYVRAGRELKDHLCQEKLIAEEPCCAFIVCSEDSVIESNETCVFNNKTIIKGERIEDGCSRICICEAGGHLKCKPRPKCPPNETIANQHDRCVVLTDPRDNCCTVTLCDVTLGDHEVKSENSTDLSVHLIDVKVLNSTAIKLKLSAKNSQDVTIEISQNNHVWRQQNPDKDEQNRSNHGHHARTFFFIDDLKGIHCG